MPEDLGLAQLLGSLSPPWGTQAELQASDSTRVGSQQLELLSVCLSTVLNICSVEKQLLAPRDMRCPAGPSLSPVKWARRGSLPAGGLLPRAESSPGNGTGQTICVVCELSGTCMPFPFIVKITANGIQ